MSSIARACRLTSYTIVLAGIAACPTLADSLYAPACYHEIQCAGYPAEQSHCARFDDLCVYRLLRRRLGIEQSQPRTMPQSGHVGLGLRGQMLYAAGATRLLSFATFSRRHRQLRAGWPTRVRNAARRIIGGARLECQKVRFRTQHDAAARPRLSFICRPRKAGCHALKTPFSMLPICDPTN